MAAERDSGGEELLRVANPWSFANVDAAKVEEVALIVGQSLGDAFAILLAAG